MADAVPTADELPKHCYMDISVAGSPQETVVFELDTITCPKTCHNFVSLCAAPGKAVKPKGRANASATVPAIATYRNTEFHRIVKGFMAQGGDFENFDGTGGRSIFSTTTFEDESFANKHSSEGILSMANRGRHTNSSQFFITLGNASHLDGKHVAFGRVVRGMDAVRQMATIETDARDKPIPMQRIVVVDCGVGMGNINSSSKEDEKSWEIINQRERRNIGSTVGVIGPIPHLRPHPPTLRLLMIAAIIVIDPRNTERENARGLDQDRKIENARLEARDVVTKNGRGPKRSTNIAAETGTMTGSIRGEAGVARGSSIIALM